MTIAILTNTVNGKAVEVYATTNHSASSYGRAVWVDAFGQAYTEVGAPTPFYTVSEYRNIDTMQDLADWYNAVEDLNTPLLEAVIEGNGWTSDCHEEFGICHSDRERCTVDDFGMAVVHDVSLEERMIAAIRKAREDKGISLRALSEMTGMNVSNLSRIERGEVSPNLATLSTIAAALGIRVDIG